MVGKMDTRFNTLEAQHEFTDFDRRKVLKVLADVVHEMTDAHTLGGMFEPYAEIVYGLLHDDRIALNFDSAQEEEGRGRHTAPECNGANDGTCPKHPEVNCA